MSWFRRIFGDEHSRALKRAIPIVATVNALEETMRALPVEEFPGYTKRLRERRARGESLDSLAPEAFALVREVSRRTLGQRHFDVQLIGGMVLHQGGIAEMRTGEGKTLVATLPTYLGALDGKGVHVVTVNDYLSRRDAVWMGQIYHALGLTLGVITQDMSYRYDPAHVPQIQEASEDTERDQKGSYKVMHDFLRPCTRTESYAADITYGTNNEFGFDYLRDNLEYEQSKLRQREHHMAIVDEIDSILIDEARTPLIISAPTANAEDLYQKFTHIVTSFKAEEDYTIDEKHKQIALTDAGIEKAQRALGVENIYTDAGIKYVHHLETAVRAQALYQRDKEYVVRNNEILIVDEFTGRLQPGRRWSDGLHQAIEAKEGVRIQQESRTFASITFQNYFRLYRRLAGMTGTATTSSEEFYRVYGLTTVPVPTNKEPRRDDRDDLIFQTEQGKMKAIVKTVKELHEKGQPVLVGTASVEKNELLSIFFKQAGIPHQVLNAKNHEQEGEIIAQAGVRGAVTIATNMAGRGVDIKLGGNPATEEEYAAVRTAGGLFVIGTERHDARRIDNQLRGRAGRQGDPGITQFFVSLEDSLMRIFASDMVKRVMGSFGIPEDEPIQNRMITKSLEKAQTRIEEINFDARKHVLAYDDVLNIQRKSMYERRRTILCGDTKTVLEALQFATEGDEELRALIERERGTASFIENGRRIMLQVIDHLWVDHLESMEYLRSSVNLRAYGQRDPLVEYKKEGLRLFQGVEDAYQTQVSLMLRQSSSAQNREVQHIPVVPFSGTSVGSANKFERNEKVLITNGVEEREMKYKKAEELIKTGAWRLISRSRDIE
ncbi:preprotein translocase subunit SecA [bacterium]|nr:preprotein translocase subunit SecA [bacterium]